MSTLACPWCGNDTFEATLTAQIEYTYSVDSNAGIVERSDTVVDGGDLSDVDTFKCSECGEDFEDLDASTLCTGDELCPGLGEHYYCLSEVGCE